MVEIIHIGDILFFLIASNLPHPTYHSISYRLHSVSGYTYREYFFVICLNVEIILKIKFVEV